MIKLFDFFFPFSHKIRIEAITTFNFKTHRIKREFYTFRALLAFIYSEPFLAIKEFTKADRFYLQRGAIAFDAATTTGTYTASTTFSHTCTGSSRGLVVFIIQAVANSTSAVTYNSVSMAFSGNGASGNAGQISDWYLSNPSSGSNTVSITGSGANTNSNAAAISFTGVNQSNMLGADATVDHPNIDATSASSTVTTLYHNSMVVDCIGSDGDIVTGSTAGTGQTGRWTKGGGFTNTGSTEPATVPASVTMSWTWTNTIRFVHKLAEIREPKSARIMSY